MMLAYFVSVCVFTEEVEHVAPIWIRFLGLKVVYQKGRENGLACSRVGIDPQ